MQHVHREVVVTQLGGGGWGGGVGGLVVSAWSVTKSVTRQKSKALEIFFTKFCLIQKSSIYIFTLATPLVAPKMVKKFCTKTKRNVDVWDSPPQPFEFFTPTPRVCTGGRELGRTLTSKPNFPVSIGSHFL